MWDVKYVVSRGLEEFLPLSMNWGKAFNLLFYFKGCTKNTVRVHSYHLWKVFLRKNLKDFDRFFLGRHKEVKSCACAELWVLLSLLVKVCILIQKSSALSPSKAEFWSWMNWSCHFWSYFLGEWVVGFFFVLEYNLQHFICKFFRTHFCIFLEYVYDWVGFNRIIFKKG